MTPQKLRRNIKKLRPAAAITAEFSRKIGWHRKEVWYRSQKEHWLGWLSEYGGPGFYGRKTTSRRSAEFAYNHIVCPPMILWLAEAAGVQRLLVLRAKDAALKDRSHARARCAVFRQIAMRFRQGHRASPALPRSPCKSEFRIDRGHRLARRTKHKCVLSVSSPDNRTVINRVLHNRQSPTKKIIRALKLRIVFVSESKSSDSK
jgi:hypothetical protein